MPLWPVNHSVPFLSKVAVFRLANGDSPSGNGNVFTSSVVGSTLTMAFRPPSVIHGAPSGPTITPWVQTPVLEGYDEFYRWRCLTCLVLQGLVQYTTQHYYRNRRCNIVGSRARWNGIFFKRHPVRQCQKFFGIVSYDLLVF